MMQDTEIQVSRMDGKAFASRLRTLEDDYSKFLAETDTKNKLQLKIDVQTSMGLVGGILMLLNRWSSTDPRPDVEQAIEEGAKLAKDLEGKAIAFDIL